MADYRVRRTRSVASVQRVPTSAALDYASSTVGLRRGYSVPNLHVSPAIYHTDKWRPRPYRRDYDMLDEYWHDRMYYMAPLYWQAYRHAGRRYYGSTPPDYLWWHYPGSYYHPYYRWSVQDYVDPIYWSRYRDPTLDRPQWSPIRPYVYRGQDVTRGIDMYKKKLIDFDTLDRNWITPSNWERKFESWRDVYIPTGTYGPRRYFYSFAT